MTQYRIEIYKFFQSKGWNPETQDIQRARDLFERLPQHDMSPIHSFYCCIQKYFDEQFLEDIYFKLFHQFIWNPITIEEFRKMEFKNKCKFVYKRVPSHAKNTFQLFFRGFVICHLQNIQNMNVLSKSKKLDKDTLSVVKHFMMI